MAARDFFSVSDKTIIERAISDAEKLTSGEIRVHLENTCDESELDHAAWVFGELEMEKTKERNGVLIYIAVESKKFAIIGDVGINQRADKLFWEDIRNDLARDFSKGDYTYGLVRVIMCIGEKLEQSFPRKAGDKNEIMDNISFGK